MGQGADHVVGFYPGHNQQRQAHGPHDVVDRLYLHGQVFRHGRPVGFVLFVHVVPEGFALGIEHHHNF